MAARRIIHVDMDEFFAAVEKLDQPELRGKPLLIGGTGPRGVVSTASYEARPFGCRSAMAMSAARRLCPQAIVLPVRGQRYRDVSEQIFEIFTRYTPLIEPVSIDEAFLDVTGSQRLLGDAVTLVRQIKQAIADEVHLTASVGVAPNKFLAKIASELHKPDGLTVLDERNTQARLDALKVGELWGVGPSARRRLEAMGIRTVAQLRRLSEPQLAAPLGSLGQHLYRLARGLDDRPVVPDSQARSISQEHTFDVDVGDGDVLRAVLAQQVEHVARRLRRAGLRARTVTLKLRTGDFTTRTRSATLPEATDATAEIARCGGELLDAWLARRPPPLRLLGLGLSQLGSDGRQLSLFEEPGRQRDRRLDATLDRIAERFGPAALRRGRPPE